MAHLRNQAAMITGGGSGIGLAIAEAVATEGMAVALAGRDRKKLEGAAAQLERKGGKALAVATDVSVAADVERLVAQTLKAFGRIDLLVNNAGTYREGAITELTEADWDAVQAVNLKGAFLCAKAVLPAMMKQRAGYIVNIASVAGKHGFGEASAYCASKFGLIGLTESLLEEAIGANIKATAICPGYVNTPMVAGVSLPGSEMIPPEDIGRLVVSLLHLSPNTVIKEIVVDRKGSIGT
ncbi:MAG: SDR family NAD(P)-dependent oxidoreductase [Nitrospirota bacterium]